MHHPLRKGLKCPSCVDTNERPWYITSARGRRSRFILPVRLLLRCEHLFQVDSRIQRVHALSGNVFEIRIPLLGLIDVDEEVARLTKEVARVESDMAFVSKKLNNEKFVAKAPTEIVDKERAKLAAFEDELHTLRRSLEELNHGKWQTLVSPANR